MSVRTLDILDLPLLLRSHDDVLPLDGARFYTRGTPLGASALLAYWNPLRHLYTAVSSENGSTLMGQMTLESGETSARMTWRNRQAGGVHTICWQNWMRIPPYLKRCARLALLYMPPRGSGNYRNSGSPRKRIPGGRHVQPIGFMCNPCMGRLYPRSFNPWIRSRDMSPGWFVTTTPCWDMPL